MTEPITGPCAYMARLPITKAMNSDEAALTNLINNHVPAMVRAQIADNMRDKLTVVIDGYEIHDPANDPVQFEPRPENLLWVVVHARIVEKPANDNSTQDRSELWKPENKATPEHFDGFVRVIDPDDVNFDRCGRVKDWGTGQDEGILLIRFYTGDGEPNAWQHPDQLEKIDEIPPH